MIVNSPRIFGNKDKFFTMKTKVSKRRRKGSDGHRNGPLTIVVILILIPAVVFGGYKLFNLLLVRSSFAIEKVIVEGNSFVGSEVIIQAAGAREGTKLFALDLDKAKANVENLPQIASANIRRTLPGTITINVTERTARAIIRTQDPLAVDCNGVLLPLQATGGLDDTTSIYGVQIGGLTPGTICGDDKIETALMVLRLHDASQLSNLVNIEAVAFASNGDMTVSAREKNNPKRRLFSVKMGSNRNLYPQMLADLIPIIDHEVRQNTIYDKTIDMTLQRPVSSPVTARQN